MSSFIRLFSSFYPCPPCAEHFTQHIDKHAPDTSSRTNLSLFFCNYHNDVNRRLGKKQFDCKMSNLDERWKDGPSEDSKYDCFEEQLSGQTN
jgi:FAD-linked sulfhydryl oxidase